MSRHHRLLLAGLAAALAAVALLALARGRDAPAAEKPRLLLLTSLPLLFGEGFELDPKPSPLIEALGESHEVTAIDTTAAAALARGRLLLMAQPRAQTADNLVALDRWVRGGGRLLLLADPRLDWPSELPLGDLNRPPPMFADTGLLGHWGLRLDAPERPGPAQAKLGQVELDTLSPGRLARTGGNCTIAQDGLVARCPLGRGRIIVVADADWLGNAKGAEAAANLLAELG